MGARAAAAAACLATWGVGGPPGIAAAAAVPTRPPVEVTGATRIEYDASARQWTFSGPLVVIARASDRLEAAEIVYNELTREVVLSRDAAVLTPTLEVTADRMTSLLDARHVTGEGHVAGRFADEAPQQRWGTFSADRIEVDDRAGLRQIVATGQVVVQQDDRRLRGDRIVYNRLTQQGTADGRVELVQGRDSLRAGHVFADFTRRLAAADDDVLLDYGDTHGSADHATYSGEEQTAVLWGHVRVRRGRDTLEADRVTAYLGRDAAIAQGHVHLVAYAGEPSP